MWLRIDHRCCLVAGGWIDRAPRNFHSRTRLPPGSRPGPVAGTVVDLLFRRQINRVRNYPPEARPPQSAKKRSVGLGMEALGQEARGGLFPPILPCRPFDGVLVRRLGEVKQVLLLLSGGAHHRKYYRSGGKRRPPAPTASHCWLTFAGVLPRGDGRERRSSGTAQASVPPSHGSPYPPAM